MNEELKFCGTICAAAKATNIMIKYQDGRYLWGDLMTGALIRGQQLPDKKAALFSACEALVRYFKVAPDPV